MNIIVTVKQVPNTQAVKIDPKTGTMERSGVPSIMNPEDKHAIEAALCLAASMDEPGEIIALSMGPPQAASVLREALAMGADRAILLCDRAFAGSDTLATAYTLAAAIKKIKHYGIVICGHHAIDGDTAQVGPQLAGCLNLPQITHAEEIDFDGAEFTVMSNFKTVLRKVAVPPPVLSTVTSSINKPRYKTMNGILRAFRDKTIETWSQKDLRLNPMRLGMNGSPTRVKEVFVPTYDARAKVHAGDPEKLAGGIFDLLMEHNFANQ